MESGTEYVVVMGGSGKFKLKAHRFETNGKALRFFSEDGTQIGSFAEGHWIYVVEAEQFDNYVPVRGVL